VITIRPFHLTYKVENHELVVYIAGRRSDGKRGVVRLLETEPYFYVPADEADTEHEFIKRTERCDVKSLYGDEVAKVVVYYPFQVPSVRSAFSRTWEADIIYSNRIRIDLGIKGAICIPDEPEIRPENIAPDLSGTVIKPRVFCIDIEVGGKHGTLDAENSPEPIVSLSVWDSYTGQYLVILNGRMRDNHRNEIADFFIKKGWQVKIIEAQDEKDLFESFTEFVAVVPPDILTGWNSDSYDFPYLQNRAKRCGYAQPDWSLFATFDLMWAYDRLHEGELESKSLQFVSTSLGLEGKTPDRQKVWEMYEGDRGKLVRYNCNDVFLTKEIDFEKKNLTAFFLDLVTFSGCDIEAALLTGALVDSYMFHRLRGKAVQPTKVRRKWDKIKGAAVLPPVKGVFKNVIEIDNSGEYANIIRTFNLSPETRRPGCSCKGDLCYILPSGNHYTRSFRGVFPETIDELVAMRQTYKKTGEKEKERVVKEFALTLYGVLASEDYRNGDPAIASDITEVARMHLEWNRKMVEDNYGMVLYGDTDSCLFTYTMQDKLLEADPLEMLQNWANDIASRINATMPAFVRQWGAEQCFLSVKVEHIYDSFLQAGAKKAYACLYRDKEGAIERDGIRYTMKVRGFEARRSDSAPITRELQTAVLREILFGWDGAKVKKLIHTIVKKLRAGEYPPTDLRLPKGWAKETYAVKPIHVRAAEWSNKHLGYNFRVGDKPCYYYGYIEGKPRTDVFALEWDDPLPKGAVLNWDKMLDRTIVQPLADILDVIGVSQAEILQPTVNLDVF